VKLVYVFGSSATGTRGSMSDYDFGVYIDSRDSRQSHEIKFDLLDKIGRALATNAIDIVLLNMVKAPEIKYEIIKEGVIIFERDDYRVLIEPAVLNEYFDFRQILRRHNLTKA